MILLAAILCIGCTTANADVYNYSPFNHNAPRKMDNSNDYYSTNNVSRIDNTYYMWDNNNQTYKSYQVQGNQIYGSDGSSYTRYGNTIQSNSSRPQSYQINNNIIKLLY